VADRERCLLPRWVYAFLVEWLLAVKAQGTQLSDVGILLRTNSQIDQLTRKLSD
jgi:superfamily I DNA/RNA helicase